MQRLMAALYRQVPAGAGAGGIWKVGEEELRRVLRTGARAAVAAGYGEAQDLEHCEDGGALRVDDIREVSARAAERGLRQLGSLGSGNHFVQVQYVERIYEPAVAQRFGLHEGQVTVMIHTGSRGLGHQVCSDQVREMVRVHPSTGSRCRIPSSRQRRSIRRTAAAICQPWPAPPTSDEPTAR